MKEYFGYKDKVCVVTGAGSVTSCGGLMWEKWRREYRKVMDCRTWDEMAAFMKGVCPKKGVGAMAYTLAKRALNYYTALKLYNTKKFHKILSGDR